MFIPHRDEREFMLRLEEGRRYTKWNGIRESSTCSSFIFNHTEEHNSTVTNVESVAAQQDALTAVQQGLTPERRLSTAVQAPGKTEAVL